ncbi:MAG: hypothetical protein WCO86_01630 [Planctomycetota bacterium]
MIFNELKLSNVCVYRGEHEFNLAPGAHRGKAKPVVLFGGMRACQIGYKIGPLFARDPSVADRLFRTFCRHAAGQQVFIDVPDNNPAAGRLCKDHGMSEVFGCVRMYLGPVPRLDNARIFAITTFEVG